MGASLKLTQKGTILVAVPLLFELVFVLVLVVLLQQAEAEVQQQAHSRAIIYQADNLSKIFHEANLTLLGYGITRSPQFYDRFDELVGVIPGEIESFKKLVSESGRAPVQVPGAGANTASSELSKILVDAAGGLEALRNARKILSENNEGIGGLSSRHIFGAISSSTSTIEGRLKDFALQEEKNQQAHGIGQTDIRHKVQMVIGAGVLLNILMSVALAVFFVRGIGRRVAILRDNSYRLAAGQKLRAPVFGGDEIAELDVVFHRMARSLQEAAQRERAILENAVDLICSIDSEGRFATVSPASMKVLGYEPEELIGVPWFDLLAESAADEAREEMERIVGGTTVAECETVFETRLMRKDGSVVDVSWSASWSQMQNSIFAVVHDITEHKEVERMKQELMAMISHDLRSPLTTIRHVLEMLDDNLLGTLDEEGVRLVKVADRRADDMLALINDLLDIEKSKAGMLHLDLEEISLTEIFDNSLQTVMGLAAERKVVLESSPLDVVLLADSERLTRAVVNLLSNAIKYSPAGGKVSLTATADTENVTVKVSDQGRGIPADKLKSVFDRFQQVEAADAKEKKGVGLGLTICKTFIEVHGGAIEVASSEGKGTVFTCKLPYRANFRSAK